MILSRREFLARWKARNEGAGPLFIRVTVKHTHPDSCYTQTTEGYVGAIELEDDYHGTTMIRVCVGGDGRHGDGRWVPAFLGSETTSLGFSRHMEITVELIDE